MKCKKWGLFTWHCEHLISKDVDNPHGQFQPNRQEKVSKDFWKCCQCGNENPAGLEDFAI